MSGWQIVGIVLCASPFVGLGLYAAATDPDGCGLFIGALAITAAIVGVIFLGAMLVTGEVQP